MKKSLKYGVLALALLLLAGVVAPFVRVDHFREQIRVGLERSLHRRVEIHGDAHLNLFRGPGFSVENVVIYDDPSAGLEPMANVAELQTTLGLSTFFTGRLSFTSVRFVDPSLNLVKPDQGSWNALALLAGAAAPDGQRLPELRISGGRVNFKFGKTKSAFYLTDTDLTVTPVNGGAEIRFACAPARTDRAQQGYGLFSGRGRIVNGRMEFDAELEKSPVEELITLVRGQSLGLHGMVQSRAHISGPLSRPEITGRFELQDVHRWDLQPGRAGALVADYKGLFETATQHLEMVAEKPFAVRLAVDRALSQPVWQVSVALNAMPAAGLVEFARHMGAPLPRTMTTAGEASGSVVYSSQDGMSGQFTVDNAVVKFEEGPEFRIDVASLQIQDDAINLLPADVNGAELAATYAPFREHLEATLKAKSVKVAPVVNGVRVPLLERFRGGTWGGTLHYLAEEGEPGEWTANISLRDTTTAVPGVAAPLKIDTADVEIERQRLAVKHMHAALGTLELYGDYHYEPDEARPHKFALTIPSADTAELEKLLQPVLQRASRGFIARTLRWRQPLPEWLRERRASGDIRIGTLVAGDLRFRALRSQVLWNGPTVTFTNLDARIDEGSLNGTATVDVSAAAPKYSFRGVMKNIAWRNGQVDMDGSLSTSGTGTDAFLNLKADGNFQARQLLLAPETLRSASGTFDLSIARTGPQLRLGGVQVSVGAERFSGEGLMQPDGRIQVDLSSPTRVLRVSGPLAPLKLAIMELPSYGPGQRNPEAR